MLETWFEPAAIAIVFAGTLAATLLRCGLADCRIALAALSGLFDKPFDPAQAKAELSVQVREIANDGFLRAEPVQCVECAQREHALCGAVRLDDGSKQRDQLGSVGSERWPQQ